MPQPDRGWAQAAVGFYALLSAWSLCKHLLEHPENFRQCRGSEPPHTMNQPLAIYGANLVENNVSGSFAKPTWNSKWVGMASCRERSDNERPQIRVELVRRDDNTRASLAHLATPRRAETNQEHLSPTNRIPGHHFHSPSSNRVEV